MAASVRGKSMSKFTESEVKGIALDFADYSHICRTSDTIKPSFDYWWDARNRTIDEPYVITNLSKREHFAYGAMVALINHYGNEDHGYLKQEAYSLADVMLKEQK